MRYKRPLILLFAANTVSGFAQGVSMLAIPAYFSDLERGTEFNIYYALVTFLTLFWGLYAGTLVDGFRRKDVFLGTNFIEALILLSVASLGFREELPTVLIVLVFASTMFGYFIHFPNLYAFAQELSDPEDYSRVTSYIEVVGQVTVIGAGGLAVVLLDGVNEVINFSLFGMDFHYEIIIKKWPLHQIFLMDGITYIVSFIIILFIQYKPSEDTHFQSPDISNLLRSGMKYLLRHKTIIVFGLCAYSIFIIYLVNLFATLPIYVDNHLEVSKKYYAMADIIHASGALFCGIVIRKMFNNISIPRAVVLMVMVTAVALIVLSITNSIVVFLLMSVIIGFTNAGSRIFRLSFLFKHVPNKIIGRINSIFHIATTVIRVILILLFTRTFFGDGNNIIYAYVILSVFTFVSGIVLLFNINKVENLKTLEEKEAEGNPEVVDD